MVRRLQRLFQMRWTKMSFQSAIRGCKHKAVWSFKRRWGRVCGKNAEHIPCTAPRYINYGKTSVTVFHYGQHTCPVIKPRSQERHNITQMLKDNTNIKPAELQSACIMSAFWQQCDWKEVEKQAEATLDRNWKRKKDEERNWAIRTQVQGCCNI
jgi:hypothetical protein